MVPIMVGNAMIGTMMIPILDHFDVYEVFDDAKMKSLNSVVATVRGKRIEHGGAISFGGVLRKLHFENKTEISHQFYLETLFYTKLSM